MQDLSADVRQSAFALVGDLAKVAAMHLMPSTADLLALGVANLQPAMLRAETMSACNNACWSLGENFSFCWFCCPVVGLLTARPAIA